MTSSNKVTSSHLERWAYIYVRQSTASQVERNRESTDRQYQLAKGALSLGWPDERIKVVDEDLARSADGRTKRSGFDVMFTEVAQGNVGLILSIEVSRVSRNNSDWYRLLDLCGVTNTLIGDEEGLYHSGLFNDRLLLGLKGTMAEAELHVIRARLNGGIRNKAARGELRRSLPVGFQWGEKDGEIRFDPDEAVVRTIRRVFQKFIEVGSVRQVWLYFQSEKIPFPSRQTVVSKICWGCATYPGIHEILTNPVYAGAYTYGKTKQESYIDEKGQVKKRTRRLPQSEWEVLLPNHHEGFIDWETYQMNKKRISKNTRPGPHTPGAIREGVALLQGLATCGRCARRLRVYYQGRNSTPGYYCSNSHLVNGRGASCLRVGGVQIDEAVSRIFLETVGPAGVQAALEAERLIESDYQANVNHWQLQVERSRYEAERAERRYHSVDPENRLVARTLELDWEQCLGNLAEAEAELIRKEKERPDPLSNEQRQSLQSLGADLKRVWQAPTTIDRDRKELLHTLIEEVNIRLEKSDKANDAHLTLRWRGGAVTEFDVSLRVYRKPTIRTEEETIDLIRRLARHYRDDMIAGILNRQERRTATGERFTANRVGGVRRYWKIPRYESSEKKINGELVTVQRAAELLGVAPSTVHRWLADGFIAGEQLTPGAPWRIRFNEDLKGKFVEETPGGYVPMQKATRILGVSRQTVLKRIKRGELHAVHLCRGRRKGLRIKTSDSNPTLFDNQ